MSRAVAEVTGQKWAQSRKLSFLLLIALVPVGYGLYFGLVHLKATWDDAAITAAFSRTWAQSGRIALTPVSQTVEGFSSILWFWLLSLPYFFTRNNDEGLVWMKILSTAFFALSIGLTYLVAKRELRSEARGVTVALMFAFCVTPLREAQNGMEMNLAALFMLLLYSALRAAELRVLYCWLLITLILLTRFESPFWLLMMLCGFLYAGKNRRTLIKIALFTIGTFAVIELCRYHLFGEWMPNTIYAKRWAPYSDWSTPTKFLTARLRATTEVLIVFAVPILAVLIFHRKRTIHPAVWSLAAGCFLFGIAFGSDGASPYGRMVEAMAPFLLTALVGAIPEGAGLAALVFVQAVIWTATQATLPYGNAPISAIERYGIAADSLRLSLHRNNLTIMVPDVGGSALCCEHLRIVDAGMLADPELSREGWSDFPSYFRRINPDAMWTERPWSTEAHIFRDGLLSNYTPEYIGGLRLYVRNDLLRARH